MSKPYKSEDITYCDNFECKRKRCERNPHNITCWDIPHSLAPYDNTKYCPKFNPEPVLTEEERKIKELTAENEQLKAENAKLKAEIEHYRFLL